MWSDLPTTIFVPAMSLSEDDNIFSAQDDASLVCLDDDDLSLSQEIARERRRLAPESRRAPPRTISASSESRRTALATYSTSSETKFRQTPLRTVSSDSSPRQGHHSRNPSLSVLHQVSPCSLAHEMDDSDTFPSSRANPLDQMYRDGLKKLAVSMRHSDMTRTAIKRQCKFSYRGRASPALSRQQDFFLSPRCDELEECRRQLLSTMIHHSG